MPQWMRNQFQFHKVRLKVNSSFDIKAVRNLFQFHKVRLKERMMEKQMAYNTFQFHKVRLKDKFRT